MKKSILAIMGLVLLTGCGVGSLVAVPFKATGAVVNVVSPEVIGDSISGVGDAFEDTIPF
ncbi:MAG: hypothetical protein RL113_266 [Pseudomonadota bacterium]|jgi:hypothetical protein